MIKIKRVYEPADKTDGYRILIDGLWPRGLSKEKARADIWMKEVAPSAELRNWFNHEPEKWAEFKRRYFDELKSKKEQIDLILEKEKEGPVTLLYGSREQRYNNAVAMKEYLETKAKGR